MARVSTITNTSQNIHSPCDRSNGTSDCTGKKLHVPWRIGGASTDSIANRSIRCTTSSERLKLRHLFDSTATFENRHFQGSSRSVRSGIMILHVHMTHLPIEWLCRILPDNRPMEGPSKRRRRLRFSWYCCKFVEHRSLSPVHVT